MFSDPTCQLLAILVLPIVAGIICVFVIVIQRPTQDINEPSKNSSDTLDVISIADAYDPVRSVLWESQISALERIGSGLTYLELLPLWERCMHLYPELYEQTTFLKWLGFLQTCNLEESNGDVVRLTANGRDFLNVLICNANLSRTKRVVH
jgi:hypothetical protein